MQGRTELDPKGLIYESYRIGGITAAECRSIFLDWALSLPAGADSRDAIAGLLERYRDAAPEHPMTAVLQQGLEEMAAPRRRGGWRARQR
ncbi:hypothetical protein ACUXV3_02580 [Roseobacteraceae bacterium NS-SX3]